MGTKETKLKKKRQKLSTSGARRPAITLAETQLPPQMTMEMTIRRVKLNGELLLQGSTSEPREDICLL
jgi:hypothetical protein